MTTPDCGREVIVILGGLPPGEPMAAEDGAARWIRREGEPFEAFQRRVMAEPIEATTGFVVFGGPRQRLSREKGNEQPSSDLTNPLILM